MNLFFGIVEDRHDPLKLGRVRARISGVHTDNLSELPTNDLPWATPIQNINSAALSGIGESATGIIEGSMVVIMFADESKQIPMIMGTIGGIPTADTKQPVETFDSIRDELRLLPPSEPPLPEVTLPNEQTLAPEVVSLVGIGVSPEELLKGAPAGMALHEITTDNITSLPFIQKNLTGNTVLSSEVIRVTTQPSVLGIPDASNEIQSFTSQTTLLNNLQTLLPQGTSIVEQGYIGTLTNSQLENLKRSIAGVDLLDSYMNETLGGALGKYKFDVIMLELLGYLVPGITKRITDQKTILDNPLYWSGKDGVSNKTSFLSNAPLQERLIDAVIKNNFTDLCKSGVLSPDSPPEKISGLLSAAQSNGVLSTVSFVKTGIDVPNADGKKCVDAYKTGYTAIVGKTTVERPTVENITEEAVDKSSDNTHTSSLKYEVNATKKPDVKQGFKDPNKQYPLKAHMDEPDTPRLSSGIRVSDTIVGTKEIELDRNIPVANGSATWDQSPVPYNAKYPFNHVLHTESGHVMEFDDTIGQERINIHHKSGTFKEIDSAGNTVEKVKGIRTIIVEKDELVYIKGSGHVNVDGDVSVRVGGNAQIEVMKDANIKVHGDFNHEVKGNYNLYADGSINFKSGGNFNADSHLIFLNSGTSTAAPLTAYSPTISIPSPTTRQDSVAFALEDTAEGKILTISNKNGKYTTTTQTEAQAQALADTTPAPQAIPVIGTCGFTELSYATEMSVNFKLRDLCKDGSFAFNGQHGKTGEELACNLKQLTLNIIEPLKTKYPYLVINSCFRPLKSGSQHEYGRAVDVGFSNIPRDGNRQNAYFEIAREIRDMGIPFDKLILEYANGGSVWLHISFSTEQHRGEIYTYNNHAKIAVGLAALG